MSLKANIFKNGLASGLQKVVRVLEQLLLVPFFIKAWGGAYYGEWLTLTIIPSIMVFSDLGFGTSAANRFLLLYASGDKQGAANTAKSGVFIISIVVVAGIALSGTLILILDQFHVFEKSLIERYDAIWALLFLMIARIINFYNQFYESYFRAARKASLSMNLQSIYSILIIILSIGVLQVGGGVVEYALANLIVSVIFNPIYNWKARQTLGLYKTHQGAISNIEVKGIMKNGFGYLLSPVWQAIYFQGTTFVVRLTLGPMAVTIFNTVRTLARSVNQIFNMISLTVFPELQFEIGAGNLEKARKLFRLVFIGVFFLSIVCLFFLYFFGLWFYNIWTSKSLNPPEGMWNVFIVGVAFNALWWIGTIIFQAFNKPYYFTIPSVIISIISVFFTYILSLKYGLTGAAIGAFILDFVLAFYILPMGCKLLGQPILGLFDDFLLLIKRKNED